MLCSYEVSVCSLGLNGDEGCVVGDERFTPKGFFFLGTKNKGLFRLGCGENRNVRVFLSTKPHFSEKVPHFLQNKGHFSKNLPHFLRNKPHFLLKELHFSKKELRFSKKELHFSKKELHFLLNEPLFCNAPQKHFDGLPTDVAHLR